MNRIFEMKEKFDNNVSYYLKFLANPIGWVESCKKFKFWKVKYIIILNIYMCVWVWLQRITFFHVHESFWGRHENCVSEVSSILSALPLETLLFFGTNLFISHFLKKYLAHVIKPFLCKKAGEVDINFVLRKKTWRCCKKKKSFSFFFSHFFPKLLRVTLSIKKYFFARVRSKWTVPKEECFETCYGYASKVWRIWQIREYRGEVVVVFRGW